jgi:oligoribonuclease (3'-5' exoribonuclease)
MSNRFDEVEYALEDAKAIAWDTCHKIYVLMDDEQVALMREYEYDPLITSDEMSPSEMLDKIIEWYDQSCGLRFVQAVRSNPEDANDGFVDLIPQFFEEDECWICGESGCDGECEEDEEE